MNRWANLIRPLSRTMNLLFVQKHFERFDPSL
jgi:hypothetical protein